MPEGNSRRVLLVGWDAADWRVIQPLIDAGKMPAVRSLVEGGVSASLSTLQPMYSPMLWTSIATGKRPFKHGIHGFTEPTPDGSDIRPVSSLSRTCKAVWNILHQSGLTSTVVGWWPSHPAEPIRGAMVSNHFHTAVGPPDQPWPLPPGAVHPARLASTLAELRINPNEFGPEEILPFIPRAAEIDQDKDKRLAAFAKILAECSTIHAAATWLLANEPWDFAAVYYDAIDHFSHGFMRYHPPRRPFIPQRDFDLYSGVVEAAYRYHDMMLGALLRLAGPDTTVILMSDHGFHPDHLRPHAIPSEPAGPAIEHREFGILAVRGPAIRRDELLHGAGLLDIAPTILTLFGLPVGEDMDGRPLALAFESPPPLDTIPSWEDVPGDDGRHPDDLELDPETARASLQQLVALGYIEPPGPDARLAVERTAQEQRYNLARAFMDAARHAEAATLLEELRAQRPDEFRFGVQLALCHRALGRTADMRRVVDETRSRRVADARQARRQLRARLAQFRNAPPEPRDPAPGAPHPEPSSPRAALTPEQRQELADLRARARLNRLPLDYINALVCLDEGRPAQAAAVLARAAASHPAFPGVHIQLGEARLRLRKPDDAERSFRQALDLDPQNPHALAGLSRCHLMRRRPYDAATAALQSIGILYQNPVAHYLLGAALQRIGRLRHAICSFEVAIALNPNFTQAHRRLALLFRRLRQPARADAHARLAESPPPLASSPSPPTPSPQPPAPIPAPLRSLAVLSGDTPGPVADDRGVFIAIVSGMPRSGTSMLMQMLAAGGFPVLADGHRPPDEDNPRGYFEFEAVKSLRSDQSWLPAAVGKAVKIVAPLLPLLPASHHYRVVLAERDIAEVVRSQRAMLERQGRHGAPLDDPRLAQALSRQILQVKELLRMRPQFRVLCVGHRETLDNPAAVARRIAAFLGRTLDIDAMAAAVAPSLHRQRRPATPEPS